MNTLPSGKHLIVRQQSEPNQEIVILKNGTKLSQVISCLPAGVIDKNVTGIGATTLELSSHRNSIIVVPTRSTAVTKTQSTRAVYQQAPDPAIANPGAMYIGGKTAQFTKPTKPEILVYAKQQGFKKFIVVADSLPRLLDAIGQDVYQDYFLMIDEVDSFQLDSGFRESMNIAIDIFKKFPGHNRALVTATLLEFSDPILSCLPVTFYDYETADQQPLDLIFTNSNLNGLTIDIIEKYLKTNPGEKILVAFNSPSGCYALANELQNRNIPSESMSILCGEGSKKDVDKYFRSLSDAFLPTPITFITSAYFTGFDLEENFHLICVSDSSNIVHTISEHRVKQIAGRCRRKLLSVTLLARMMPQMGVVQTKEEMLEAAEEERRGLACFLRHYSGNPLLLSRMQRMRKHLMMDNGLSYTRIDEDGKAQIAYLAVDAELEQQRVSYKVYADANSLKTALTEIGYNINAFAYTSSTPVAKVDRQARREAEVAEVISYLEQATNQAEIEDLGRDRNWSKRQQDLISLAEKFWPFIDYPNLLNLLKVHGVKKKDGFDQFRTALTVAALDPQDPYIQRLYDVFRVGKPFSKHEAPELWDKFFRSTAIPNKPISVQKAAIYNKIHFEMNRARLDQGVEQSIKGPNALTLLIKKPASPGTFGKPTSIFESLLSV